MVAKRLLGAVVASTLMSTLLLSACVKGGDSAGDTVISYNTPEQWANWGTVLKQFSESSGITAPNDPKNSGQALAALQAEAGSPAADVAYFGLVFGMQAKAKGLVAPFESDTLKDVPADLKAPDGSWFAVHQGAIAFLVNTDALGDTPVPKCWKDLTSPQYKGKVGFLDPKTAAVGYSVMAAANLGLGGSFQDWSPGLRWAAELKKNGLSLPAQTATSAVQQGEIPILIDADFNGYKLANIDDAPIQVVLPCEGSISLPYVMSLVKNGPHQEAGRKLLEYALSDEAQRLFAESYLHPIRDVDVPDEVAKAMAPKAEYDKLVKTPDFAAMDKAQAAFLKRWDAEVAG